MIRNKFLIVLLGATVTLAGCQDDDATVIPSIDTGKVSSIYPVPPAKWMGETDPYYTEGYIGDVMPYYAAGAFHLYFLHDAKTKPSGLGFHDIHQLETSDLKTYDYKGRMVPYGAVDEPDFGVGTGSVVAVGNQYYFYYTGHNESSPFIQQNARESVLCAVSEDLEHWTKLPDFKLTAPAGYYDYDFRDPHVFYNQTDGKYWMVVSTQTDPGRKAVLLVFTTSDPAGQNWEVSGPLYTTTVEENYLMLECADIFEMGGYWYLLFSENWSEAKGTRYRMATSLSGPWITPDEDRLDGEYLYAAKTAFDGNHRYLFGWAARKSPETNAGGKQWAGNLVTHQLWQNTDGTLRVSQPQVVSDAFDTDIAPTVVTATSGVTESGNQWQFSGADSWALATFEPLGATSRMTMEVSPGTTGRTGMILSYDADTQSGVMLAMEPSESRLAAYMLDNGNRTLVNYLSFDFAETTYELSLTINKGVGVIYLNDQVAFTNRIYDTAGNPWALFAEQGSATYAELTLYKPN